MMVPRMMSEHLFLSEDANALSSVQASFNESLPTIVIWALRILVCLQAYMYHSVLGLFHLTWVLASFIT